MFTNRRRGVAGRFASQASFITKRKTIRVWRSWLLVEAGFLLTALALFNLFPQLIGIDRSPDAVSSPTPLISTGFAAQLPWLNLWLGIALSMNLVVLFFNIRRPEIRWIRMGINLFGLYVLLRLVLGGPIISYNTAWAATQSADNATVAFIEEDLVPLVSTAVTAAISIAVLGLGLSILQKIWRLAAAARENDTERLDNASLLGQD